MRIEIRKLSTFLDAFWLTVTIASIWGSVVAVVLSLIWP